MGKDDPALLLRLAELNATRGDRAAAAACAAQVLEGAPPDDLRARAATLGARLLDAPGEGAAGQPLAPELARRLAVALGRAPAAEGLGAGPPDRAPADRAHPAGDAWARSSGTLEAVRRLLISPDVLGRLRDVVAGRGAPVAPREPAAPPAPSLPVVEVVTRLLAADLDVEATAALALDLVARAGHADRAHLLLAREADPGPRAAGRAAPGPALVPCGPGGGPPAAAAPLVALAARDRQVVEAPDLARDPRCAASPGAAALAGRGALVAPIPTDDGAGLVGALYLEAPSGRLDAAARGLVLELAALVGPALDKARRFEARGAALSRAERLLERERAAAAQARAPGLVGASAALRELARLVDRVAPGEATVLIEGESGSGKELVARAIHARSPRAAGPFVAENLGALSTSLAEAELFGHARGAFTGAGEARPGLFQVARGGTLLLDEVAEAPLELQAKLLRVLQEREVRPVGADASVPVDVRVLAATHRDLRREVAEGRFREDLYYRLSVVRLRVPPLRERREDVPALLATFVARAAADQGVAPPELPPELVARLQGCTWPGNVRQLEGWATRYVVAGLTELPEDRPPGAGQAAPPAPAADEPGLGIGLRLDGEVVDLRRARAAFDRTYVALALERHGGSVSATAKALGLNRTSLSELIGRLGLRG